tara:strand:+ start:682 stop:1002 length:321 start_codon:yes stop_codon:yes gene_type:complete
MTEALQRDSALNLAQAAVGCIFQVTSLEGPACRQLREIGFCEKMHVSKITGGRTLLCKVCGARLALSRELAQQVQVKLYASSIPSVGDVIEEDYVEKYIHESNTKK